MARELVEAAARAGADYVKFQTFRAEELASPEAVKAQYQSLVTNSDESQFQMLKKLELSRENHFELRDYCARHGIGFLSSPFSDSDLDFLLDLGIDRIKLPSGEITNYPLLRKSAQSGLPIILSTGMATLSEIASAVELLLEFETSLQDLTLLQCTTEYPTPFEDVNLRAMNVLASTFGTAVGLSDHSPGIAVPIAAVTLEATIVEKHFTLDKTLPGPDHQASLDPDELRAMVTSIRQIEKALGSSVKRVSSSEAKNRSVARKSLHLRHALSLNAEITEGDLVSLRPGNGLSPMLWPEVVGRRTTCDLPAGHKLQRGDFR